MCRLLGYVAAEPRSLHDLLGAVGYDEFTALSAMHKDGWGMAWRQADGTLAVDKSPQPANRSDRYRDLAHRRLSDAGIVHLRWATPTLAVTEANSHPFVRDGMAFAHNGRILPPPALTRLVAPGLRAELEGTTDSERFFFAVRSRLAAGAPDLVTALQNAAREIIASFDCSSLNCLLMTERHLYALSCYDEELRPLPAEPEHFMLRWRRLSSAVLVASSGWAQDDWNEVPNGHVLVVDRATREANVVWAAEPPVMAGAVRSRG